jgi:hypothetical protein
MSHIPIILNISGFMRVKAQKKVNKMYGTAVPLTLQAVHILAATSHTFRSVTEIRDLHEVFCQGP